jgi:hypothetical protein
MLARPGILRRSAVSEQVEFLTGELDGDRWYATWTAPFAPARPASEATPVFGVWRIVLENRLAILEATGPTPGADAAACRAALEAVIRARLASALRSGATRAGPR